MAIVVEGFDNTGKSTLARYFQLDIKHPGPRPKTPYEEATCLQLQLLQAGLPVVLDRITSISTACYGDRMEDTLLARYRQAMTRMPRCIVVYCRPPLGKILDFSTHESKDYDTSEQEAWLKSNAVAIVGRYDRLMSTIPHVTHDWTNPNWALINKAKLALYDYNDWRDLVK